VEIVFWDIFVVVVVGLNIFLFLIWAGFVNLHVQPAPAILA